MISSAADPCEYCGRNSDLNTLYKEVRFPAMHKSHSGVAMIVTRFSGLTIHTSRDDGMTWDEGTYIDTSIWAMGDMIEVELDLVLFTYMDSFNGKIRVQYIRVTPASEKRTLLTALHVAEEVCAPVAHRQVVLTIPQRLRLHARFDRNLPENSLTAPGPSSRKKSGATWAVTTSCSAWSRPSRRTENSCMGTPFWSGVAHFSSKDLQGAA